MYICLIIYLRIAIREVTRGALTEEVTGVPASRQSSWDTTSVVIGSRNSPLGGGQQRGIWYQQAGGLCALSVGLGKLSGYLTVSPGGLKFNSTPPALIQPSSLLVRACSMTEHPKCQC